MLFMSWLRWWYGLGWRDQAQLESGRLSRISDFFSIGLSARTLFAPFKQIDAAPLRSGSLDRWLRAVIDQLFSRFFGAVIRMGLIIAGLVALGIELILAAVRLASWPLLPALPLLCVYMFSIGWLPWR